ncbi:uncharacterized protein LOC129871704 [Solanum dulcamara]|uniref:uncharacterized protein LOC129871704 n=1 Tax=Solanum dulcamara TaxID=45834 RepID=UPI00248574FC|nr:uncharacterized protein LOC129871704 [Solanum dulcamara]
MVAMERKIAMLIREMDIYKLMNYVEQVKSEKIKVKNREFKRPRIDDSEFSHGKFVSDGRPCFYQKYSGQVSSNATTPRFEKDRVHNTKPQGGVPMVQATPACKKCGRNHKGECLVGSNVCYQCGKMGHNSKECKVKYGHSQGQVAQGGHGKPKGSQCNNRFYALHGRQEVEETLDVISSMLQVFHYEVYTLLDPGENLSFVSPYVVKRFDVSLEILLEPFSICTSVEDVKAKQYQDPMLVAKKSIEALSQGGADVLH